ncbi:hypothetical protein EMMF5_001612 [Cystobasidiomycetes sp. EMM_F5]
MAIRTKAPYERAVQEDYIEACRDCGTYLIKCPNHPRVYCHDRRVAYVDGACSFNGQPYATSGLGVAIGELNHQQFSKSITSRVRHTNQRADIAAAISGLHRLAQVQETSGGPSHCSCHAPAKEWIIATNSSQIVETMTDLLIIWRHNDWCKANGKRAANLDLWLELERVVDEYEEEYGIRIGFLKIRAHQNQIADELAKDCAQSRR